MRQLEHQEHTPAAHHGKHIEVLLAGLKDPLNVGHAFRISSALGVRHIYLCDDTPVPPIAKINRTARGAQHQVPWSAGNALDVMAGFSESGLVICIEYATDSIDIREVILHDKPILLVLGNEAHGISSQLLEASQVVAHLPMYGAMSSLNVATALAMSGWECVR